MERTTGAEISPTAKLAADLRRYSDIPLAAAIAERTDAASFARDMPGGMPPEVVRWMAPLVEARYRSIWHGIERSGVKQVLEFASGFSFRGPAMANASGLRYIETDLSEIHATRLSLRNELERDGLLPRAGNCAFAAVDLLSAEDLDGVAALLRPGEPVAIVHEGIFPYFSAADKATAARHIARLLARFGGVWLTPDFKSGNDGIERLWATPGAQALGKYLGTGTGRTTARDKSLNSEARVRDFLSRHGFAAEKQPAITAAQALSSAAALGTPPVEEAAVRQALALWWMGWNGGGAAAEDSASRAGNG